MATKIDGVSPSRGPHPGVNAITSGTKSTCSTADTSPGTSRAAVLKNVQSFRSHMQEIDFSKVKSHFKSQTGGSDPFVVCDGVSVEVFNEYFRDEEDDRSIGLCFAELGKNGRVYINEIPSGTHEAAKISFEDAFCDAFGNKAELGQRRSTTVSRSGEPDKEADTSFGPMRGTPGRTPPPLVDGKPVQTWVTLAVENGVTPWWGKLSRAALWWFGYVGVEYILLLEVSKDGRQMCYRQCDVINNPLQQNCLPQPLASGTIVEDPNGEPVTLTFDNRRILSIPAAAKLPDGVWENTVVDLRAVMRDVIRNLW